MCDPFWNRFAYCFALAWLRNTHIPLQRSRVTNCSIFDNQRTSGSVSVHLKPEACTSKIRNYKTDLVIKKDRVNPGGLSRH